MPVNRRSHSQKKPILSIGKVDKVKAPLGKRGFIVAFRKCSCALIARTLFQGGLEDGYNISIEVFRER